MKDTLKTVRYEIEHLPSGGLCVANVLGPNHTLMLCDCCLQQVDRSVWMEYRGFCVTINQMNAEFVPGQWAFCIHCWALFKRRDLAMLAARVTTLNPRLCPDLILQCYSVLADCVYGTPRTDGDILESEV